MTAKRLQWLFAVLTIVGGSVLLYAQNPVSIAQVGTTAVTTTVPVSGTVTATGTVAATQSGTWTVQPGNTANTTAWKVDGSAVTQPVSGTVTANAGSGTLAVSLATVPSHNVTNSGTFAVQASQATAANLNATVVGTGTFAVQPTANATVDNNKWNGQALASPDANSYVLTAPAATATAAAASTACNILAAASTNSTSCKGSAGNFYGFDVTNTTTTVYYLRLYNTASAPTCSSATGFIRSIPIPPAAAAGQVGGIVSNQVVAVPYTTGIGYCITGGSSSTDNTNAATGVFGEIRYK